MYKIFQPYTYPGKKEKRKKKKEKKKKKKKKTVALGCISWKSAHSSA
jgi:hypothetical protein